MDERRDQPPPVDRPRARLSPLQEAWADYRRHTSRCERCRERGGGRCDEASRLLKLHADLCDEAYRKLAQASSPQR